MKVRLPFSTWVHRWFAWFPGLLLVPAVSGEILLRVGVIELHPDQAHQVVTLIATNSGPSPVAVGGLDLSLAITSDLADVPQFGIVDLVSGSVFDSYAPIQAGDPANTPSSQAWYLTLPALGLYPEIPARAAVPLASVEIDTRGLKDGEFILAIARTDLGRTALYDTFGQPLLDFAAYDGTLRIVPAEPPSTTVPDGTSCTVLLLLVGWVALRVWRGATSARVTAIDLLPCRGDARPATV